MKIKIRDTTIEVNKICYNRENENFFELSGKMKRGEETTKLVSYTMDSYINDHIVEINIGNLIFSKIISGSFEEEGEDLIFTIYILKKDDI